MPQTEDIPDAGFTLLEVIVAFAIASLSLAVLFQTFSGGLRSIRASQIQLKAAFLAHSKLAEFENIHDWKRPVKGRSDGFAWSIERTQHLEFACAAWLNVRVTWPGQAATKQLKELRMTTLISQVPDCQ